MAFWSKSQDKPTTGSSQAGSPEVAGPSPAFTDPSAAGPEHSIVLSEAMKATAVSKLVSAAIGDAVVLLSRSTLYKHYALADIEWMVLPAVASGQFYIAEAQHKEQGFTAPIALVSWAKVSPDVDRRLAENVDKPIRLRPDEWTSGSQIWLVHAIGNPNVLSALLKEFATERFKDEVVKVVVAPSGLGASVMNLRDAIAAAKT